MESNKRREHNTKRVGAAIRGNSWPLTKPSVNVIPRTADKVEPKTPTTGHPRENEEKHQNHIQSFPRITPPKIKPKGEENKPKAWDTDIKSHPKEDDKHKNRPKPNQWPDDKPKGGGSIAPKPKPKNPHSPLSGGAKPEQDWHRKPEGYESNVIVSRKK